MDGTAELKRCELCVHVGQGACACSGWFAEPRGREVDVLDSGGKKSERRVNDQEMKPRLSIHKH